MARKFVIVVNEESHRKMKTAASANGLPLKTLVDDALAYYLENRKDIRKITTKG